MISICRIIWTLFCIWLFILKIENSSIWDYVNDRPIENLDDFFEKVDTSNTENIDIYPPAMTSTDASKSASGSGSQNRKRTRSETEATSSKSKRDTYIDYTRYLPHTVELSQEKMFTIYEKERELTSRKDKTHKWPEFYTQPFDKNSEFWHDFCVRLWPGIEGREGIKKCKSKVLILEDRKLIFYRISSFNPSDNWSFMGDLLSCSCKYGRGVTHLAVPKTMRYFFAMKISDNEYFLATHLHQGKPMYGGNSRCYKLKIVDFVNLS